MAVYIVEFFFSFYTPDCENDCFKCWFVCNVLYTHVSCTHIVYIIYSTCQVLNKLIKSLYFRLLPDGLCKHWPKMCPLLLPICNETKLNCASQNDSIGNHSVLVTKFLQASHWNLYKN